MKNPIAKLLAATVALATAASASAYTFDVNMDAAGLIPGNPVVPPIVGTGTFTFANDPGNGTFAFSALGAFSLTLSFVNGDNFNQAQITSQIALMKVVLSGSGLTRRVQFSDTGSGGGGSVGGSLDLNNGAKYTTFEPSFFGPTLDLYQEFNGSVTQSGNYSIFEDAADFGVPDASSTLGLFAASCVLLGLAARRVRPVLSR